MSFINSTKLDCMQMKGTFSEVLSLTSSQPMISACKSIDEGQCLSQNISDIPRYDTPRGTQLPHQRGIKRPAPTEYVLQSKPRSIIQSTMKDKKRNCYESMEDKELNYSMECKEELMSGSDKRHNKDESGSFDSQETAETSRENSQRLIKSTILNSPHRENNTPPLFTPPAASLECSEHLGVPVTEDFKIPEVPAILEETKSDVVSENSNNEVLGLDTLNYLISREQEYSPDPYYMEKSQPDLTWTMRLILVDWMMEVCMEFQLKRETYHYSVNFVDRFLSTVPKMGKSELQLVGATALNIAAKMEEVCNPKLKDFAKATDNGYTTEQIRRMELLMTRVREILLMRRRV